MPAEFKDKISDDDKKAIETAVEEAKKHKDATDKDELEKAAKDLQEAIMPIGAKMYEAASKDDASAADEKTDKDEPVEGEVVDSDDAKK